MWWSGPKCFKEYLGSSHPTPLRLHQSPAHHPDDYWVYLVQCIGMVLLEQGCDRRGEIQIRMGQGCDSINNHILILTTSEMGQDGMRTRMRISHPLCSIPGGIEGSAPKTVLYS